jgi:large repetitive protein
MKYYFLPLVLLTLGSSYMRANISITTTTVPNGTVNTAYSAAIATSGGCAPATWTISSGTLPPGVTIKASNKPISLSLTGTPTSAATYSFTLKVKGCGGGTATKSYTVVIQAAANHVVDLNWQASTSQGIAGYNVYRSPDGATWKKLNVSLAASTVYTDSTVSNGSIYYYAVTARDINGNESSKGASVKVAIP